VTPINTVPIEIDGKLEKKPIGFVNLAVGVGK